MATFKVRLDYCDYNPHGGPGGPSFGYPLHPTSGIAYSLDDDPVREAVVRQTDSAVDLRTLDIEVPGLEGKEAAAVRAAVARGFGELGERVILFPRGSGQLVWDTLVAERHELGTTMVVEVTEEGVSSIEVLPADRGDG